VIRQVARRWWPVLALALLLLALQGRFWFGDRGWREARALQDIVSEQRAENARLQQRNDALGAEVEDLKSGETAVEERARSELGMVKPGETFYRVVEPHARGEEPAAATTSLPPQPAPTQTMPTQAPPPQPTTPQPTTPAAVPAPDSAADPATDPAAAQEPTP
jgi:cell division protein FtsB